MPELEGVVDPAPAFLSEEREQSQERQNDEERERLLLPDDRCEERDRRQREEQAECDESGKGEDRGMRRFGPAFPLVIGLATTAGAPAGAALLNGCPDQDMTRPFLRWLDPISYTLAPDGGFEAGARGWQLRGGAEVVDANESFRLSGAGDSSLLLPSGSSATSPAMCVETLDVFARYVAKNKGLIALSSLKVDAIVKDSAGNTFAGVNTGGSSWAPSLPSVALLDLLGLLNDGRVTVSFRFQPVGLGARWQIDDLYVDPLKMG